MFCPLIGGDLQVFDVNHDGYDDLICHTSTGIIQISESHIVDEITGGTSNNGGNQRQGGQTGQQGENDERGMSGNFGMVSN